MTLEHLPNFINGNEIQMFIRTHGIAHQQSVQSHACHVTCQRSLGSPDRVHLGHGFRGSSSHRARTGTRMRKKIGVNGGVMADAPIVIRGDHARLHFLLLVAVLLRTASRWCPSQFVGRYQTWGFIASSYALGTALRRSPPK